MKDVDFSECKFISEVLRFITFFDFCDRRESIKLNYEILSDDGKIFYRWYVYANVHMDERYKNACWDYVNGYMSDWDLLYQKRFYKIK